VSPVEYVFPRFSVSPALVLDAVVPLDDQDVVEDALVVERDVLGLAGRLRVVGPCPVGPNRRLLDSLDNVRVKVVSVDEWPRRERVAGPDHFEVVIIDVLCRSNKVIDAGAADRPGVVVARRDAAGGLIVAA